MLHAWEERRGAYKALVSSKLEGRRPIGRSRRRWEVNTKMDFRDGGAWTGLIWRRIGAGGGLM